MLGDRGCFCDYYKRPLGSPWYGINDADILLYTFFDWNRCYFLNFLAILFKKTRVKAANKSFHADRYAACELIVSSG